MKKELLFLYKTKKGAIKSRIEKFKSLPENQYQKEFLFCLLTPQSNAKKCWEAVEQLSKLPSFNQSSVSSILKTKTRFHNNKTKYILESKETWNIVKKKLENAETIELRNYLAENVKGYGLKEASHFLRNIGFENLAILDRHILRTLHENGLIEGDVPKSLDRKRYLKYEKEMEKICTLANLPQGELDFYLWYLKTGKVLK